MKEHEKRIKAFNDYYSIRLISPDTWAFMNKIFLTYEAAAKYQAKIKNLETV